MKRYFYRTFFETQGINELPYTPCSMIFKTQNAYQNLSPSDDESVAQGANLPSFEFLIGKLNCSFTFRRFDARFQESWQLAKWILHVALGFTAEKERISMHSAGRHQRYAIAKLRFRIFQKSGTEII